MLRIRGYMLPRRYTNRLHGFGRLLSKGLECKNSVRTRNLYKTGDTVSARSNLNRVSVFFFSRRRTWFYLLFQIVPQVPDTDRVRDELEVSAGLLSYRFRVYSKQSFWERLESLLVRTPLEREATIRRSLELIDVCDLQCTRRVSVIVLSLCLLFHFYLTRNHFIGTCDNFAI